MAGVGWLSNVTADVGFGVDRGLVYTRDSADSAADYDGDTLLLETGDRALLETGVDLILLEA